MAFMTITPAHSTVASFTSGKLFRILLVSLGAVVATLALVAAPQPAHAAYSGEITVSSSAPRADSTITVTGTGYASGVKVTVKLVSTLPGGGTITLGSFTSGHDGVASGDVKIPGSVIPGDYQLVMSGLAPDNSVLRLTTPLTVRTPAHTGVDELVPVVAVGAVAALAGVGSFVVYRRRSKPVL